MLIQDDLNHINTDTPENNYFSNKNQSGIQQKRNCPERQPDWMKEASGERSRGTKWQIQISFPVIVMTAEDELDGFMAEKPLERV